MKEKLEFSFGEPVVIAQSDLVVPKEDQYVHWGFFQFPIHGCMLEDGTLFCGFDNTSDNAEGPGEPIMGAISADKGKTWKMIDASKVPHGLLLPNGDIIRPKNMRNFTEAEFPPPPTAKYVQRPFWDEIQKVYDARDVEPKLSYFYYERKRKGSDVWEDEFFELDVPFMGVQLNPRGVYHRGMGGIYGGFCLAPDGKVWMVNYGTSIENIENFKYIPTHIFFAVSEDDGNTFSYVGRIPFKIDKENHPNWEIAEGFSEADMAFLPDGSMVCLMRTTAVADLSASYICFSSDNGANWSTPEIFDDRGVFFRTLTLGNGVLVTSYGRPNVYLRATLDGHNWEERIDVTGDGEWVNSCGYTTIIPLTDDTFYLMYSCFRYPNSQGVPVKTILGRTVTVKKND